MPFASHSTTPIIREDVARKQDCSYTDEKLLSSLRTLRALASRDQESLLWSVCNQTLFHTFPKLKFSEQIKDSSAINFGLLSLTDSDDAASQIRKLYAYAISQPDKCIEFVNKLLTQETDSALASVIRNCLTQPAFALTKHSTDGDFTLIAVALCYDNLALAKYLTKTAMITQLTSIVTPLQFNNLFAILAKKGNADCLRWLCDQVDTQQTMTNDDDASELQFDISYALGDYSYRAFRHAAINRDLKTMQLLYELADKFDKIGNMLAGHVYSSVTKKYHTYYEVLRQGHLDIAQWIYNKMPLSERKKMIVPHKYSHIFRFAAKEGRLPVMKWLYQTASPSLSEDMIHDHEFDAFRAAVLTGHMEIAKWIWDQVIDECQHMLIQADNYYAFRVAVAADHFTIVKWIYEHANGSDKQAMLKADHYFVFRAKVVLNNFERLDWLWQQASQQTRTTLRDDGLLTEQMINRLERKDLNPSNDMPSPGSWCSLI